MIPKPMIEDKRKIRAISKEWWSIAVGQDGITEIIVYQEPGQIEMVNWFAIYKGNFLFQRADANEYTIEYMEE
jgi:hypothetical protein